MSADQNFEARANLNKQNKGTALNLMEAFDPQPKRMVRDALGDLAVIPAHQDLILHQTSFDITYNPTTAVNGTLLSTGGQVDITIPEGGGGGTVSAVLLEFDVANITGADCRMVPAPLIFRDITIYANGGSLLVQTIPGDHLFTDLAFMTTESLTSIANAANTNNTLSAGVLHPNNTSRTYAVPIFSSFLTQCNLYAPAIKNGILFRLNFRPGSDTMIAGAVSTISNVRLHIIGASLPIKHHTEILNQYNANQYDFRFTNCLVNSIPVNIAASSTYNLTLSGVQGMMAGAFLVFRTGTTGTAIFGYQSLFSGTFDIVDSNDRTLLGSPKRGDYNLSWEWKDQFQNNISQTIPLYYITHAASLRSVVDSGVMSGFNYYDNNTRIKITTDASWIAGNRTVDLFFKQYAMLRIINGRIQSPLLS